MKVEDDDIIMDDGTKYYANNGIIGLCPGGGFYSGYDDRLDIKPEHREEIATYMIELWTKVLFDSGRTG